jgi:hypothetical protein
MTATNHALTGAVIALAVKQPALALPLAFLSHFVCDAIPHFDTEKDNKLAKIVIPLDLLLAVILILSFTFLLDTDIQPWLLFGCMALATSPDIVWGWRFYKLRNLRKIIEEPMLVTTRLHQRIQWSETRKGSFVEAPWFIVMLLFVLKLK